MSGRDFKRDGGENIEKIESEISREREKERRKREKRLRERRTKERNSEEGIFGEFSPKKSLPPEI